MKKPFLVCALLFSMILPATAGELHPFGRGEMQRILEARQGRPFALLLWSIDCPYCKVLMDRLVALARENPKLDLVAVSTDGIEEPQAILAVLEAHGLGRRATWAFAGDSPERLRYEIDRRWSGELPRTYLFDAGHRFVAFSGPLPETAVQAWLAQRSK
ncbi:MAG: hypothetical protein CVU17_07275 [Betaproteobacteria bacterium HGW-Betaproteobacteria-11]|nr:MAG: hypothetical protein CVU17_07275 [Betaproteobacteria bacterium HGW-Betaproteobacteria-11]